MTAIRNQFVFPSRMMAHSEARNSETASWKVFRAIFLCKHNILFKFQVRTRLRSIIIYAFTPNHRHIAHIVLCVCVSLLEKSYYYYSITNTRTKPRPMCPVKTLLTDLITACLTGNSDLRNSSRSYVIE